jgi:hypothetical protein
LAQVAREADLDHGFGYRRKDASSASGFRLRGRLLIFARRRLV